jgi:RNA-splicing ligase RtcB
MIELTGEYNTAKVFTDNAEFSAINQVKYLLNQPFMADSQIRIMPDVHAGMGCVVGMSMTITNKLVPGFIGFDIGCGVHVALLKDKRIEFNQFDKAVHQFIPAGFNTRSTPHHFKDEFDLTELKCAKSVDIDKAIYSIGTLGGGNHFIEVGQDDDKQLYLIIHSGSRALGKQVCEYYQRIALADAQDRTGAGDRLLSYLEGDALNHYLHDMRISQEYADLNRRAIVRELEKRIKIKITEQFSTVHNYIDLDRMILRKGTISAQKDEKLIVPMNMRDGSLLCVGKGNPDWNYSAPHGAGRAMSRKEAKEQITLTQYEKAMKGVFSTTVSRATIDEAPFAYKPMQEVIENSSDTMTIIKTIKPLYNFKAGQE